MMMSTMQANFHFLSLPVRKSVATSFRNPYIELVCDPANCPEVRVIQLQHTSRLLGIVAQL